MSKKLLKEMVAQEGRGLYVLDAGKGKLVEQGTGRVVVVEGKELTAGLKKLTTDGEVAHEKMRVAPYNSPVDCYVVTSKKGN